jgi:hypothetical protein
VGIDSILDEIDAEIARLHEVRKLLSGAEGKPGQKTASKSATAPSKRPRRKMSAEARAKIAEAQKKRWAAAKKSANGRVPKAV